MDQRKHYNTASTMSAAAPKAKRGVVSSLQGPRPLPLNLPATTTPTPSLPQPRPSKRPRVVVTSAGDDDGGVVVVVGGPHAAAGPVIVYEHTPRVIHARPDEFKDLVQRLTGRSGAGGGDQQEAVVLRPAETSAPQQEEATTTAAAADPLVLTLGQQVPPPPLPLDIGDHATALLPSPGGAAGFFLLSPGSFLFSPATMQAIHELIS